MCKSQVMEKDGSGIIGNKIKKSIPIKYDSRSSIGNRKQFRAPFYV